MVSLAMEGSKKATRSMQAVRRLTDLVLRREARAWRWAGEALPERRIQRHRNQLADFAAKLEKRFVGVAGALDGLAASSAQLLESSRRLLNYSLGKDSGSTFESAVAAMELPLNFNDECLEITNKVDGSLARVAIRIGRLHHFKAALDGSIAPLRILQTMFRIESASSSPEIQALFTSLSAEIERLLVRMSTLVVKEFEAIESTGSTVNEVIARLREVRDRQIRAQARRLEIGESLRALEAQLQANKERDVRLIGATLAISEKLSGMVGALQFQDILNQKLQHIQRGLGDIVDHSRARKCDAGYEDLDFLRDASRVESAHLEDVENILGGAISTLRGSLDGLAGQTEDLGSECILLKSVESSSGACDGMVQVLLDTIRENVELTESASARSQQICEALEPIGGLLGNLTGSILELSARIRLIALNAQIQAVQAGEGTGLEVLSSKTRTISEEMAGIVAEIAEELAALKEGLKSGLEDIGHTRTRSLELLQFLQEDGKDHEARLHGFRDQMLGELRRVADLIARVQGESKSVSASLDMRAAVADVVTSARRDLQQFSERLSARLGRRSRSSRMAQRALMYTAASEHSTHERALRDGPADERPEPMGEPPQPIAAGSIELF